MADIVNLNRTKKRRAHAQEAALAQQNRARFGRTGAEKARDQRTQAAREALLDGKRREASPGDPPELPDPPEIQQQFHYDTGRDTLASPP